MLLDRQIIILCLKLLLVLHDEDAFIGEPLLDLLWTLADRTCAISLISTGSIDDLQVAIIDASALAFYHDILIFKTFQLVSCCRQIDIQLVIFWYVKFRVCLLTTDWDLFLVAFMVFDFNPLFDIFTNLYVVNCEVTILLI